MFPGQRLSADRGTTLAVKVVAVFVGRVQYVFFARSFLIINCTEVMHSYVFMTHLLIIGKLKYV